MTESDYTIHLENNITVIKIHREIDFDGYCAILKHLAEKNIYHLRCFDLSNIKLFLSHDEVKELANLSKQLFMQTNRSCIVVHDDLGYGTVRSLIAYRDEASHMQMFVARSLAEGIVWLEEQKQQLSDTNQG